MNAADTTTTFEAHPIQRRRADVANAWHEIALAVSPAYGRLDHQVLRDRIEAGIDALILNPSDRSTIERFLDSLVGAVDRTQMSVEDIIAGLLGGCEALDRVIPPEERYSAPVVESERALRSIVAQFASRAVNVVTRKLEVEAALQRESRSRLLALQRVGAAVTSSLELDSALETIVQEAARLMNGVTARLRLADEDGRHLRLIASARNAAEELPDADLPVESTLAGLCYRSGRPVISNDVAADPRSDASIAEQFRARSLLSVPLLSRGAAIGVLSIVNLSERPFEEADAEVLSLFADHAAVAIENARLFQQAQSQITELEILNRVSAVVSATLDLSSIYGAIHQEIARIMVADAFLIMLRNNIGGVDAVYSVDLATTYAPRHNVSVPSIYRESMEQRLPFIVETARHPDFLTWERFGDMTRRVQSLIVAPLVRGREPIGVITAQSYAANSYRQRDAELLSTVANVAGVAIENARLYEQAHGTAVIEERNRLAREIHDTVAQGLAGIILQLEAAEASLDDAATLSRRIQRAMSLARVNLDEARRSVRDLRAAPLDRMSLSEALEQLVAEHREACGSDVYLRLPPTMPLLNTNIETTVFRFVQEALTNCRKHASDAVVWIDVTSDAVFRVNARDSGPGFDVEAWRREARGNHFGLHGMLERVERLGGALDIESTPGVGTTLSIVLPLGP